MQNREKGRGPIYRVRKTTFIASYQRPKSLGISFHKWQLESEKLRGFQGIIRNIIAKLPKNEAILSKIKLHFKTLPSRLATMDIKQIPFDKQLLLRSVDGSYTGGPPMSQELGKKVDTRDGTSDITQHRDERTGEQSRC